MKIFLLTYVLPLVLGLHSIYVFRPSVFWMLWFILIIAAFKATQLLVSSLFVLWPVYPPITLRIMRLMPSHGHRNQIGRLRICIHSQASPRYARIPNPFRRSSLSITALCSTLDSTF